MSVFRVYKWHTQIFRVCLIKESLPSLNSLARHNWSMRWKCAPSEVSPVPEERNSVILFCRAFCNRERAPCSSADTANCFGCIARSLQICQTVWCVSEIESIKSLPFSSTGCIFLLPVKVKHLFVSSYDLVTVVTDVCELGVGQNLLPDTNNQI